MSACGPIPSSWSSASPLGRYLGALGVTIWGQVLGRRLQLRCRRRDSFEGWAELHQPDMTFRRLAREVGGHVSVSRIDRIYSNITALTLERYSVQVGVSSSNAMQRATTAQWFSLSDASAAREQGKSRRTFLGMRRLVTKCSSRCRARRCRPATVQRMRFWGAVGGRCSIESDARWFERAILRQVFSRKSACAPCAPFPLAKKLRPPGSSLRSPPSRRAQTGTRFLRLEFDGGSGNTSTLNHATLHKAAIPELQKAAKRERLRRRQTAHRLRRRRLQVRTLYGADGPILRSRIA